MAVYNGTLGDDIYGGTEDGDTIRGQDGDDTLSGGAGNDSIDGQQGEDTLSGEAGNDTIYATNLFSAFSPSLEDEQDIALGGAGDDLIYAGVGDTVDGGDGTDRLALDLRRATGANTIVLGGTSVLADGGSIANVEYFIRGYLSRFDDVIDLSGATGTIDFPQIFGMGGADELRGSIYDDYLYGGNNTEAAVLDGVADGNDVLHGGDGSDHLFGGAGDDTLHLGAGRGNVQQSALGGAGEDRIYGEAGSTTSLALYSDRAYFDLRYDVDILVGADGNDEITAGLRDRIDGAGGTDQLIMFLRASNTGVVFDLSAVLPGSTYTFMGTSITSIERVSLEGTYHNDLLTGAALADELRGEIGNDTLRGLGGNDTLDGQGGDDVLEGGDGDDQLRGSSGTDILRGGIGDDRLLDEDGFALADRGNDLLDGGEGDDVLTSRFGDDTLIGGSGNDRLVNTSLSEGTVTMLGGIGDDVYSIDLSGTVVIVAIEQVGEGRDTLEVNSSYDTEFSYTLPDHFERGIICDDPRNVLVTLTGTAMGEELAAQTFWANAVLNGLGGDDRLADGKNSDELYGGEGDDIILAASVASPAPGAQDLFSGGEGSDTVSYEGFLPRNRPGATVDLRITGVQSTGIGGSDTFVSIENLTGSSEDDVFHGDDGANRLEGRDGDDQLYGNGGNDTLIGGAGDDILVGGTVIDGGEGYDVATLGVEGTYVVGVDVIGVELLTGSAGMDGIIGDDAANRIDGGDGRDWLSGGGGNDTLNGNKSLDSLYGNAGDDVLRGNDDNDVLYGQDGEDSLGGGSGDDALYGGVGDDFVYGNEGADRLNGGQGLDTMVGGLGDDRYYVDEAGDVTVEAAGEGTDSVTATIGWTLADNIETLYLSGNAAAGTGNTLANALVGAGRADTLRGLGGNDTIRGNNGTDTLEGGEGNDVLFGGALRDTLTGGAGADDFRFAAGDLMAIAAQADRITDFSHADADQIYLNLIDADTAAAGDQAFANIGAAAFSGVAGQLRVYAYQGDTMIAGDTDGDAIADLYLRVAGSVTFTGGDLVL